MNTKFLPAFCFQAVLLLFCFRANLRAAASSDLAFPQELEADLSAGTSALYHLNFSSAEAHFNRAIRMDQNHPAAYFFMTMSKWYRLSYDSLLNQNPVLERSFEVQADVTIAVAKKFSRNPDTQYAGYLYWGGGLGAKGWN